MSFYEVAKKIIIGDWSIAYIATKEDVYDQSIKVLKEHKIKHRVQIKKGHPDEPLNAKNAYYIKVLRKDYKKANALLIQYL